MSGFDKNQMMRTLMTIGGTTAGSAVGQPQLGAMAGSGFGQAIFADDQKHGMAIPAGGPGGRQQNAASPALQILSNLQAQMQQEEQQRQQAIQQLLMTTLAGFMQPQAPQHQVTATIGEPRPYGG